MKKILSGMALSVGVSLAVSAGPIDITVNSSDKLYSGGVADKTEYGQSGNSAADNLAFLKTEVGYYNPTLATPTTKGDLVVSGLSGNTYTPSTSGDYEYVVFHFSAGNAGSPGGYWEALYLGVGVNIDTLTFTLPQVGGKNVGGFSSAVFFDDPVGVPDGGMTLALLGMSLCAIHGLRRRLGAA
jgi:hypothetical protein